MGDMLMRMPVPYEPLKKNRFIFRFPSELGIQEWWISSASRPKYTSTETEIPFLNTSTFVAGRFTWDSMQITFRDPIGPSATQGYAAGYKKDVELEMLDPTGVVVQKWILQSTQLNDADFGSLDYSSNDLADITCTIRFDRAINVF